MNLDEHEEFLEPIENEEVDPIKREDKIFNNRYNTGDGLPDSENYEYTKKISVAKNYSNEFLKDVYDYEENLNVKLILSNIFAYIETDKEIDQIFFKGGERQLISKIKLTPSEINFIFDRINSFLSSNVHSSSFYNPIYILEVISSISSIEYKKIFDVLETDFQELLLIELNSKYKILDGHFYKKNK